MKTLRYVSITEVYENSTYQRTTGRYGYMVYDKWGNPFDFATEPSFFLNRKVKWQEMSSMNVNRKCYENLLRFKFGRVYEFAGRVA